MGAHVASDGLESRLLGVEAHAHQGLGDRPGVALASDRHLHLVAHETRRKGQRLVQPTLAGRAKERLLDLLGLGNGEGCRPGDWLVDWQGHARRLGDEPG